MNYSCVATINFLSNGKLFGINIYNLTYPVDYILCSQHHSKWQSTYWTRKSTNEQKMPRHISALSYFRLLD